MTNQYSFCETITAGSRSKWHVRRLTAAGSKLGGGADTPALCGIKVSWDLKTDLTDHHLRENACPRCLVKLIAIQEREAVLDELVADAQSNDMGYGKPSSDE